MSFKFPYRVVEDPLSEVFQKRRREAELSEIERANQRNQEYWRERNIRELAKKLQDEDYIEKAKKIIDEHKTREEIQQKEILKGLEEANAQGEAVKTEATASSESQIKSDSVRE